MTVKVAPTVVFVKVKCCLCSFIIFSGIYLYNQSITQKKHKTKYIEEKVNFEYKGYLCDLK